VIGFLHMLYPALLDMSQQLDMGQDRRATWSDRLAHLSALPLAPAASVEAITKAVGKPIPADKMVILESEQGMQWVNINRGDRFSDNPPVAIQGSSAGMNSLQTVFPAWNVGVESSEEMRQAAFNTVDYTRLWYDSNNTSNFYPAAADAGYDADSILQHLNLLVSHIGYPNFAYKFGAGGVENEATVPTTIAAMLLQSYQKNIHVFPNWSANQEASFGDLLAVGDFLVSSSIRNGKVVEVRITSQRGGTCNLANPWGSGFAAKLQIAGGASSVLRGTVLTIATRPGERLVFTPSPN
jgi:alpha-L-fucosidase 2